MSCFVSKAFSCVDPGLLPREGPSRRTCVLTCGGGIRPLLFHNHAWIGVWARGMYDSAVTLLVHDRPGGVVLSYVFSTMEALVAEVSLSACSEDANSSCGMPFLRPPPPVAGPVRSETRTQHDCSNRPYSVEKWRTANQGHTLVVPHRSGHPCIECACVSGTLGHAWISVSACGMCELAATLFVHNRPGGVVLNFMISDLGALVAGLSLSACFEDANSSCGLQCRRPPPPVAGPVRSVTRTHDCSNRQFVLRNGGHQTKGTPWWSPIEAAILVVSVLVMCRVHYRPVGGKAVSRLYLENRIPWGMFLALGAFCATTLGMVSPREESKRISLGGGAGPEVTGPLDRGRPRNHRSHQAWM